MADPAIVRVLRHLFPGADGHPGGVLAGYPERLRQSQLRVRHFSVPPYHKPVVHHHLRTHAGHGLGGDPADNRCRLPARLLDGSLPDDVQDARIAHGGRSVLDPNGYLARDFGINILYTKYAVAVGLVYNYLPLFILPVFASLERMDWTLIEAATDLGARPFSAFRQITLRLTLPGVVTGALLVFIPMTGEYIIPNILSGGNYEFVGNVIGDQFNQAQNQPFGSALSIGLMAALSLFVIVYILFARKEERFGG